MIKDSVNLLYMLYFQNKHLSFIHTIVAPDGNTVVRRFYKLPKILFNSYQTLLVNREELKNGYAYKIWSSYWHKKTINSVFLVL